MSGAAEGIYGTTEPPIGWQTLSAGPLSVDLEAGQLRYIRYAGVEVLRAISFLARDRYWGTFAAEIDGPAILESPGRFVVRYEARCAPDAGDLRYEVEIVGEASGRLRFSAWGAPKGDFLTNRTGFVVLHPLQRVAGEEVVLDHAAGGSETVGLPQRISPHEPAQDIFAITHRTQGLTVRVEMTGDAYDMEDQRNWTDASFKTYIRPLSKPKPYAMAAGEPFEQSVTVSIDGVASTAAGAATPAIRAGRTVGTAPRIGLAVEGGDAEATLLQANLVKSISEILGRPAKPEDVPTIAAVALATGARLSLQFAIPGHDPHGEVRPWAEAAAGLDVFSVLVIPDRLYPLRPSGREPGIASLEEIARAARAAFPSAEIGGGVMTGFTELNRNRPTPTEFDFLTHATSAIVHAADDRSVIESLEALPHLCRSAVALAHGKPYRLGPVAIGLALNPDGPPRFADPEGRRATMIRNDPRQRGLFAAAWLLGYASAIAGHGVETLVAGQVIGDFGALDPAGLRPIYHVARALALAAGKPVAPVEGLPDHCAGLLLGDAMWLANLSPTPQKLRLPEAGPAKVLDTSSLEAARGDSTFFDRAGTGPSRDVELGPFAVAKVFQ